MALRGNSTCATPVTASGIREPGEHQRDHGGAQGELEQSGISRHGGGAGSVMAWQVRSMTSSRDAQGGEHEVDELDADERRDDPADAVDEQDRRSSAAAPSGR